MITKEILERLRKLQLKNQSLGDKPKPMFKKGIFNFSNWNGGDDLIRDYFVDIEDSDEWQRWYEIKNGYLTVMFYYAYDQAFGIIIHDKIDSYWEKGVEKQYDVYFFTWYKHRGETDLATLNGQLMTEEQYIKLLNLIEQTGYKFKI